MSALSAVSLAAKPDPTLSATEQRRANPDFIRRCAISTLAAQLPLRWPTPPSSEAPPSPKPRYRSHYQPPDPLRVGQLDEPAWGKVTLFDLLLLLVDFSGLRPRLAQKLYRASARGRIPFDPISCFLLFGWQLVNRWKRLEVLRHLADPRNADYACAFGFRSGLYPSESGYRYFLTVLGQKELGDLIGQSMALVEASGVIPTEVLLHATVSFDGQIHDAASRLHCHNVQASCYQPSLPESPRPCPAKEDGKRGCDCDTTGCRAACKQATPWDPEARYVWYRGNNREGEPAATSTPQATPATQSVPSTPKAESTPKGEGHYGYRSLPSRLIDPIDRVNWTLDEAPLAAANTHEERPAAELLERTVVQYPWVHVEVAVGDAGLGYEPFLRTASRLQIRRVVDLRADPRTDGDKEEWALRGYDDVGWPICQFAYRYHSNGYDEVRHRNKWCCRQSCQSQARSRPSPSPSQGSGQAQPQADLADLAPECPYRDRAEHPLGRIVNVKDTFEDGSYRLVRDLPYGSLAWKRIYRRARNGAEERNAQLEAWGLKRLPVFGTWRAQATIFLADLWGNLITLARLIKEATITVLKQAREAA